jgi:hypothetical protein
LRHSIQAIATYSLADHVTMALDQAVSWTGRSFRSKLGSTAVKFWIVLALIPVDFAGVATVRAIVKAEYVSQLDQTCRSVAAANAVATPRRQITAGNGSFSLDHSEMSCNFH